jgi:hypothetical protein
VKSEVHRDRRSYPDLLGVRDVGGSQAPHACGDGSSIEPG